MNKSCEILKITFAKKFIKYVIKFIYSFQLMIDFYFKTREQILEEMKGEVKIEGGYSKPKIKDVAIIAIFLLPFKIASFFYFNFR